MDLNKGLLIPYYLMSSYLYYKEDKSVLTDEEYDYLCKRLLDEWDSVEHMHKYLIDKGALKAGTGYQIKDYPARVIGGAKSWYKENEK